MAVSIGSVALFAGILAAVLSGGPLLAAGGLTLLLRVQAAVGSLPPCGCWPSPDARGDPR